MPTWSQTCRSKGTTGKDIGNIDDCVVPCKGLRSTIRKVEALEDYDPRPHGLVRLEVRSQKELQDVKTLKAPKRVPGVSRGEGDNFFPQKKLSRDFPSSFFCMKQKFFCHWLSSDESASE